MPLPYTSLPTSQYPTESLAAAVTHEAARLGVPVPYPVQILGTELLWSFGVGRDPSIVLSRRRRRSSAQTAFPSRRWTG